MDRQRLRELLERVRNGATSVEDGVSSLQSWPVHELSGARVDTHRELRCGFPEVIYGEGKTAADLIEIASSIVTLHGRLLATRVDDAKGAALEREVPGVEYHTLARTATFALPALEAGEGKVLVVAAGTSDAPVAHEAALTARMLGARTELLIDVGVAGIHRLLAHEDELRSARVVIVVAGMEGALASVVGGLVDRPVIAVPTSIGYGAAFEGIAPLLTMLNSCAAGVTVVNIDNGFGAGYAAARINAPAWEEAPL